jgi:hypothetical protein
VEVFEQEQQRCGSGTLGEERKRLLEHAQLRPGRLGVDLPGHSERAQRLDERLVRKLGADEIDRAPDENLETGVARPSNQLGGEASLPDSGLPGGEDRRTASGARRVERALELLELATPSHEHLARASHLPVSIAQRPATG